MADRVNNGENTRGRPFSSGNGGRPRGARNRRTVLVEQLIEDDAEAIAKAVIASAKGGDPTAMRLCLERLAPVRKGRPIHIDLPPIETTADLPKALGHVAAAMARAEISPEEAASIAAVLETQRKAVETHDLSERIAALEAAQGKGARR